MESGRHLNLVTHLDPKSPVAEAYRILRTNLNFASLDQPFHTLLLTSPTPKDGKSTNLANLGMAMAQSGRRTVILDCDMRRPTQHKIFHLDNSRGFTNLLVDREASLEDYIQPTMAPNLDVLSCGPIPPNPSELLASKRTLQLLEELKQRYQAVLIDSPPVVAVTDATILAAHVDAVILVVRSHATRIDMALHTRAQLEKANARLLGVILNGVPMSGNDYYYYYYYGHGTAKRGVRQMVEDALGSGFRRLRHRLGWEEEELDFD